MSVRVIRELNRDISRNVNVLELPDANGSLTELHCVHLPGKHKCVRKVVVYKCNEYIKPMIRIFQQKRMPASLYISRLCTSNAVRY